MSLDLRPAEWLSAAPNSTLLPRPARRLRTLLGALALLTTLLGLAPTAAVAVVPGTGTSKPLVIRVHWGSPDQMDDASTNALLSQTAAWYAENSYGKFTFAATSTPWLRIATPTPTNSGNPCYTRGAVIKALANAAATAQGYRLSDYTNIVYYFPWVKKLSPDAADCGYPGWASGNDVYVNGMYKLQNVPNPTAAQLADARRDARHVLVHEYGHALGLPHSHSNLCTAVVTGSCTFSEYGDSFDEMGGTQGHYNAAQKQRLGWLGTQLVDATRGSTTTLLPFASQTVGPKALKIDAGGGRVYWIEYRQRIGTDVDVSATGTNGLLVRVTGPGSGASDGSPSLIDVRPSDGLSVDSATLLPGSTWYSPEGYAVRLTSANAGGAAVTVKHAPRVEADQLLTPASTTPTYAARLQIFGEATATVQVQYGETSDYGQTTPVVRSGPADAAGEVLVSTPLTGLTPGKTYHYRAVFVTSGGISATADRTFVASAPPTVLFDAILSVDPSIYLVRAQTYGQTITHVRVQYGLTTAYGSTANADAITAPDSRSEALASVPIPGLIAGKTYHYRALITTAAGTTTTADRTLVP